MASLISKLFIRDRFTWLAYFMLAYYSYNFTLLGPLMPFLRSELDLSYTVTGLHLSTFALGMAMAGFSADYFSKRWVRWVIFFGGRRWDGLGCAGGGRSAVRRTSDELVTAGAGGGSRNLGPGASLDAGAGGGLVGEDGSCGQTGAKGGSQTGGGAGGSGGGTQTSGQQFTGGAGHDAAVNYNGGGGGGGWYGGGACPSTLGGGGGGGSSHIPPGGITLGGTGAKPGAFGDPDYVGNIAYGSSMFDKFGNGRVLIRW